MCAALMAVPSLTSVFFRAFQSRPRSLCVSKVMSTIDASGLARALDEVKNIVVRRRDARDALVVDNDDVSGIGRIEAALAGNDSSWHLRVNRVERGKLRAWYVVKYPRGVPVRAQPHIDSAVLRFARRGEIVVGVSLTSDGWLELAGDDGSGANIDGGAGWMLTEHIEHRTLLERVSGDDLPVSTMRLASAESVSQLDHSRLPFHQLSRTYRVVHAPLVAVRSSPSIGSNVVGHKLLNHVVRSDGRRGDWIRCVQPNHGTVKAKEIVEDSPEDQSWMLTVHPEYGRLLLQCNTDGSDAVDSEK